jgi:uncharacterized protein YcbX
VQVTRLSTTPIKGFQLQLVDRIEVRLDGALGDRDFFLVDDHDELVSVVQTAELMPLTVEFDDQRDRLRIREGSQVIVDQVIVDEVIGRGDGCAIDFHGLRSVRGHYVPGAWDEVLSDRIGKQVRLVRADSPGGGHDVEPLTLVGLASVAALSEQAGTEVDPRRFRMLIEFDGAPPFAEDEWQGQRLSIGTTVLEVGGPVQRCAGTTRNPATGAIDLRTLTIIGAVRGRQESIFGLGFNLGVYARCITPGSICVGDRVLPDLGCPG